MIIKEPSGRPGAVTILDREWSVIATMFVIALAGIAASGLANASAWVRHGESVAVIVYGAAVVIAAVWGCARAWRIQVRIDEHGVIVRNFFRTRRVGWPQIDRFEDGSRWLGQAGHIWVLRLVRRDGRVITSTVACLQGWRATRRREMLLKAVRQAAAQRGIPTELTGHPPAAVERTWRS